MFRDRLAKFQTKLFERGVDVALIRDDDNVYYLTGYYDYLHMEFGRTKILVVPKEGDVLLITPSIDLNSATAAARILNEMRMIKSSQELQLALHAGEIAVSEVALASQKAALDALRPGVTAESIHAEYPEVIQGAGYEYPFRCGRATGFSFLEAPQLVTGDKTIIQPGMVLAVDGSVSVDKFRAQIGDSFIITDDGWEPLTHHTKSVDELVL